MARLSPKKCSVITQQGFQQFSPEGPHGSVFLQTSFTCLPSCVSATVFESWQLPTPACLIFHLAVKEDSMQILAVGPLRGLCVARSFPVWLVCLSSLLWMPCLWPRFTTGGIPKLKICAKRSFF